MYSPLYKLKYGKKNKGATPATQKNGRKKACLPDEKEVVSEECGEQVQPITETPKRKPQIPEIRILDGKIYPDNLKKLMRAVTEKTLRQLLNDLRLIARENPETATLEEIWNHPQLQKGIDWFFNNEADEKTDSPFSFTNICEVCERNVEFARRMIKKAIIETINK